MDPGFAAYVPELQGTHCSEEIDPLIPTDVPAGHWVQAVWPIPVPKLPERHRVQLKSPFALENVPFGHFMHAEEDSAATAVEKVPDSQRSQPETH